MAIINTTLPASSVLNQTGKKYDYTDSFQGTIADKENKLQPVDIGKAFLSAAPKWMNRLLALRDKIAGIFGLKTSRNAGRQSILARFTGERGERVGLFKVFDKTDKEIVLGEDDRHLDFKVSLFLDKCRENETEKQLTISTTVVYKNLFGRLYFLFVKPFHQFIAPAMLQSIIQKLTV